ncbi:hypothetical protein ACIU1J_03250 [Azospirillum doebereinerae]|uniref:hypothetical protein n=1 Tax=Azospirillum doebereinerae TaxID=92933 RepID=UPI001EE59152|nr:hypothetical protein [Azospirillum doebereinerae]MCG5241789.1 hypothetical protein [Azospirillum doebereinerae]
MSVSMVSSSVSSQTLQRPQVPGKEIRQGIDTLKKAVESGDLTSVQSAYDSLSKLQADKQGSSGTSGTSSAGSDAKDPLSKLLTSVGEALKTGDVSAVQQAVAQNGPPGGGGGGRGGGPGGAGGPPPGGGGGPPPGGGGEVGSAVGSLAQSLQSGDVSGAQDSLTSLTKLLTASSDDEDEDDSSSTSSTTSASSSSNSFLDKLKSSLGDIGSALQSGDVSSAQKLFASVATRGSQGVNVLA